MSKTNSQRAIDLFEAISSNQTRLVFFVKIKNFDLYEFSKVVLCEKIPCVSNKNRCLEDSILFTFKNEKTGKYFKKRFGFNYFLTFVCK